jgi:hypothetical protein
MSNTKKTSDKAVIHKLDNKDRDTIDKVLLELEIVKDFNKIITDYADFDEYEDSKSKTDNILLTYYDIKRNKQSILTLLYETDQKINAIRGTLRDLMKQ